MSKIVERYVHRLLYDFLNCEINGLKYVSYVLVLTGQYHHAFWPAELCISGIYTLVGESNLRGASFFRDAVLVFVPSRVVQLEG